MDSRECSRVLIVCIGIGEIVQSPYMVNLKDAIINTLTLMLEAVADQNLWIWHAYFGVLATNNDLNVLYDSPLFDDVLADRAPEAPFIVNGKTYNKGDGVSDQHSYCFNIEDNPNTFDEAIKSQDVALWKEAINDEIDSIMGNNTWVLVDLPTSCKPLVARISTIRLLIALALIHNLIIHQMDVKTSLLNGELDEEVYMNQTQGFIMPGNEDMVCKLIKSLYILKHAPKQWHQKFDEVVLSNGYLLNQADKYVYSKFNEPGKEVNICLYVDDMLIFSTDQVQVDQTKEFLSSRFSIKDMEEAGVILGIRIKYESNGIAISQSHYIEKVLKKFNYFDCTPVSTHMDISEKLMPNNGQVVSQLEYSRVIDCLIYSMTCTRPDIAFAVGK
ncbi:zinc finger, CCHC-type containing protein, partial [Tanacetum coccineum]